MFYFVLLILIFSFFLQFVLSLSYFTKMHVDFEYIIIILLPLYLYDSHVCCFSPTVSSLFQIALLILLYFLCKKNAFAIT